MYVCMHTCMHACMYNIVSYLVYIWHVRGIGGDGAQCGVVGPRAVEEEPGSTPSLTCYSYDIYYGTHMYGIYRDLVGMVLDVAAWGPERSMRSQDEDPSRVIKALKTLIKSWKALWEKGTPVLLSRESGRDGPVKSVAKGREGGGWRHGRGSDGAGDPHVKATLSDLSSRLHRTEQTLQKVLTPGTGNTPIAGGIPRGHSAARRGGGGSGGRGGSGSGHASDLERRGSSEYDSDHTVLDEDVYASSFFDGRHGPGSATPNEVDPAPLLSRAGPLPPSPALLCSLPPGDAG